MDERLPIGFIVLDNQRRERVVEVLGVHERLPRKIRFNVHCAYDEITAVCLEVTLGRGETRNDVRVVGKVELTDLSPRARGTPLEVVLDHRGDELVARLTDTVSGRSAHTTITDW